MQNNTVTPEIEASDVDTTDVRHADEMAGNAIGSVVEDAIESRVWESGKFDRFVDHNVAELVKCFRDDCETDDERAELETYAWEFITDVADAVVAATQDA
jgi:hypothetical protein